MARRNHSGLYIDSNDLIWMSRQVGEVIFLDTSITGVVEPPTNNANFRYAKLTAGLTGGGGYNNGILTSESLSGSAPTNTATAVIALSGSPINGQTINLLNSEGRIQRPSTSAGTKQNDQMQQITGSANGVWGWGETGTGAFGVSNSGALNRPSNGSGFFSLNYGFDSANSPNARTGTETRPKNVGVTAYMRIK